MFIRFSATVIFLLLLSGTSQAEKMPSDWLKSMDLAHKTLNFTMPMVHLEPNSVQSYLFEHGVSNDKQVVYMAALSGPVRHSYRVDDIITYMEPETGTYSVKANKIVGPSPAIFVGKTQGVFNNYSLTMIEKGRVAGRITQLIRLKAKDKHRYNYILWLDQETSLLLRYDLFDLNNNLLEQVQAVGLQVSELPSENITKLAAKVADDTVVMAAIPQDNWTFNWLPSGFKIQSSDAHRVISTEKTVEYLMLTDGITQLSVYIASAGAIELPTKLSTKNGISVANYRYGARDVTVIGRLPYETAMKIARSIRPK